MRRARIRAQRTKNHGREEPDSPGRGYAKAEFPASGDHKGDKSPHEMHDIGNLVQKIITPAISNKSRHPGKPEKVTELLHDIHPHKSESDRRVADRLDFPFSKGCA